MDRRGDSFTCFPDLPYELRCQTWDKVVPDYGIYLVKCDAASVDHTHNQDSRRTLRLALRPADYEYGIWSHNQRGRTQKILLATCVESRAEFCRHFPDTLGGGVPRFSFRHDLIYIVSDVFLRDALMCQKHDLEFNLEFEGGWNTLVHRLALNGEFCQTWSCEVRMPALLGIVQYWHCLRIKRFMDFLTTCISLKQLVLARSDGIGFDAWLQQPRDKRTTLTENLIDSYGGLTCPADRYSHALVVGLDRSPLFLRQIILDDLESVIDPSWVGKIRTGYPMLKDLEVSKMVHVSCELRWLCKEL